jgi:methionyl-tRNA synthetase
MSDKCESCGTYGCVDDKVCGLRVEANKWRIRVEEVERSWKQWAKATTKIIKEKQAAESRASRLEAALKKDDALLRTILDWSYKMPTAIRKGIEAALTTGGDALRGEKP